MEVSSVVMSKTGNGSCSFRLREKLRRGTTGKKIVNRDFVSTVYFVSDRWEEDIKIKLSGDIDAN